MLVKNKRARAEQARLGKQYVTHLPDHDHKAKLTDLTMGEKEDTVMNMSNSERSVRTKKSNMRELDEEEKV